ncbi:MULTISPECIES: bifunctional [glutamine synthetase] adenylyltransferase/[glutamine synthetase]-adenylyl-L-tyrosine phosphorylase [unclassified Brucella]|uniref:bifunctional [glutamine synthetase] adenylyltransferase/[glutamine synthetase]-adenylyl-L-tyrosine phosphorylase n=1 Tax=unclassified Brucella TaxID=2632610 RepID=UPI0012AD3CC9|nr:MULTISPECIES: bifunctional [glutamine synthetase] adenylyltransferase/[glutamine synthetase]-adenylyl-L-tyrosine phosphorylase [unclassified Brucella]MRN42622.1 bifunctional [glutamine synthetase] adenylyltransferase/[glutamine synthetase]-adenylyl-L-tyrosine phosphorylase [Brucella sp. 09RB8913]MRN59592.1 bifunctional [glutamine synthetase] adenylyltransferase/[glutamine synthetase]-adenylyl-L-tyrosine phosphorylase [Brucella sp. 09RB8918]CAB4325971.1 glutamate-ammonia-ligase adenylyltransfe
MTVENAKALFFERNLCALTPLDPERASGFLADLEARAREEELAGVVALLGRKKAADFLSAILDLSPFIREALTRQPRILDRIVSATPESALEAILVEISASGTVAGVSESELMTSLRQLKREAHVLIALCDLARIFNTETTTDRLTDLAEACTGAAVRFLLLDADAAGRINLPDRSNPEKDCGWIVLGMGKFGARELNYSSDIDLIVFIDETKPAIGDPYECVDTFSRLTRRLVRILQDRTGDGYVFRVDLRLRPDPGSTPLAIPVGAALHYYEGRGQNWERAAMIKARPVAGDRLSGKQILAELSPYVWRKYLDYAAIADVHSIKRQIHAHKGHGDIAVRGHNVKLGRGGIREIEFFVQTQQLIAGGRFPELRGNQTVPMLARLAERGWITQQARDALAQEYWFLRDVEHRIQMIADEQTHILPEDDEGFARVSHMMGYADPAEFSEIFLAALKVVEKHYAALFEQAPELGAASGNLVFTGDVDDPGTLETLAAMGYERPSDICRVIRTWHFGRYRATQSAEARERLTELTPALLKAFAETRRADESLLRFDGFLQGLPAGIQLFSLLQSNPRLLNLLVMIMSAAPRLADIITRNPHVFDGLLDPAIFSEVPTRAYLEERLRAFLGSATDFEEVLDRLRIFAAEHRFLIGIRLLTGAINGVRAGQAFSDLAELMVGRALEAVEAELQRRHGKVKGAKVALLAMGKLGSRELTAGSDVDLILLYDHDKDAEESDGEKPLAPSQYYIRLTQRLIAALSAPTAEGVLYEVDMRLRPSGNKGPVATHIEAFGKYQRNDAWTWEHMALTRARPIHGDEAFIARIKADIEDVLAMPRDVRKLAGDVSEMRDLITQEKPPRDDWDLKLKPGGIIDLEFIAQFATLAGYVKKTPRPFATEEVLANLDPSFADPAMVDGLVEAHRFYTNLSQAIRLCLNDSAGLDQFPPGMRELLCRVAGLPDIERIEYELLEHYRLVRAAFDKLVGHGAD